MRSRGGALRSAVVLACVGAPVALPAVARANGNNSHLWITLEARDHLPQGALKQLLVRPDVQVALQNGASFPDGGYALHDDYGEMAHWEPFVIAYMDWIRAHYQAPFQEPEAALHVAFLMGIASHGMGDQVYDSLFMDVARVYDAAGWSDEFLFDFDTATDTFFVEETGFYKEFEAWAPSYELSDVYLSAFDYDIAPSTMDTAQRLLASARAYPHDAAMDPAKLAAFHASYPWAADHMMDARVPGGPPTEAAVISAYLLVIWDRLNGHISAEDLIVGTTPSNGAGGQPTDHTLVESQVGVIFGHAIADASLSADTVTVEDASGQILDVERSMWRTESNVLRLRPKADWPADQVLTVRFHPGLKTIDGLTLEAEQSFQFSTSPAKAGDPLPGALDPTPNPVDPEVPPPPPPPQVIDDGENTGCRIGAARNEAPGGLVVLGSMLGVAIVLVRRRDRR